MELNSKEKANARARKWRDANRERVREINRNYRKNNPDKIRSQKSKCWASNPGVYFTERLFNSARRRSKESGVEFTITREFVLKKVMSGMCEMTGLPFSFAHMGSKQGTHPFAPSLDRIDPIKGYTPENSRLVLWGVNCAKNHFDDATVLTIAKAIVNAYE
jgi:hypothetical protein